MHQFSVGPLYHSVLAGQVKLYSFMSVRSFGMSSLIFNYDMESNNRTLQN